LLQCDCHAANSVSRPVHLFYFLRPSLVLVDNEPPHRRIAHRFACFGPPGLRQVWCLSIDQQRRQHQHQPNRCSSPSPHHRQAAAATTPTSICHRHEQHQGCQNARRHRQHGGVGRQQRRRGGHEHDPPGSSIVGVSRIGGRGGRFGRGVLSDRTRTTARECHGKDCELPDYAMEQPMRHCFAVGTPLV